MKDHPCSTRGETNGGRERVGSWGGGQFIPEPMEVYYKTNKQKIWLRTLKKLAFNKTHGKHMLIYNFYTSMRCRVSPHKLENYLSPLK